MNYLAHFLLSGQTPEGFVGSFLGDFAKGNVAGRYPPVIVREIGLHRQIDSFTDSHPLVHASKNRVRPERRRLAGIMVDVFYDHFLAQHWADYTDEPLTDFAQRVYAAMTQHRALLPETVQSRLSLMIADDWLLRYRTLAGIEITLQRIAQRLKRDNSLAAGIIDLQENYTALGADFIKFWPELANYAKMLHAAAVSEPSSVAVLN